MNNYGKDLCKQLKDIRRQIASDNDIPLEEHECHYDGPCKGTCPRCDAELQYLETELGRRGKLSKAAIVAGMTLSLAASSCTTEGDPAPDPLMGDVFFPEDTTQCPNNEKTSSDDENIILYWAES
ncbi:MAG: hypothetical protein IKJ40_02590 [Bacteroidales bacterium]|nr:hypothetical protein [Bacteroidales bacterium]